MNKNLLFFVLILFFIQTTYPMIQPYDVRKHIKQCNYVKKPISINLHELARTNMTIIGSLPFAQACKKVHKLIHPHNYLSDDQELFLNILALPFDLSLPILFGKDYDKKQAMIEVFCSQPVGKALELYSMLAEKYAKDKKLASLISFDELYTNHSSYTELYDAIKYFSHNLKDMDERRKLLNRPLNEIIILPVPNPEDAYKINGEQLKRLIILPDAIKNDFYFDDKNFLITSNYQELIIKNLSDCIFALPMLIAAGKWDGGTVVTSIIGGNLTYCFWLCFKTSMDLKKILDMKPLKLSKLQYPFVLKTFIEQWKHRQSTT